MVEKSPVNDFAGCCIKIHQRNDNGRIEQRHRNIPSSFIPFAQRGGGRLHAKQESLSGVVRLHDTYCNSAKIGSTWETVGIQVAVDKSNSILWFPRTIVVCLIFLMPYHRNIPSDCCFWVRSRKERVCLPTKWICPRCVVNFSGMECLAETGILFGGRVLFGGWWVVDVIRLDLSLRWSAKNQHILHRAPAATQLVPGQRAPK